ncbi:hypothetical protein B0H16DRAFT_1898863, partial [Mycena metata]
MARTKHVSKTPRQDPEVPLKPWPFALMRVTAPPTASADSTDLSDSSVETRPTSSRASRQYIPLSAVRRRQPLRRKTTKRSPFHVLDDMVIEPLAYYATMYNPNGTRIAKTFVGADGDNRFLVAHPAAQPRVFIGAVPPEWQLGSNPVVSSEVIPLRGKRIKGRGSGRYCIGDESMLSRRVPRTSVSSPRSPGRDSSVDFDMSKPLTIVTEMSDLYFAGSPLSSVPSSPLSSVPSSPVSTTLEYRAVTALDSEPLDDGLVSPPPTAVTSTTVLTDRVLGSPSFDDMRAVQNSPPPATESGRLTADLEAPLVQTDLEEERPSAFAEFPPLHGSTILINPISDASVSSTLTGAVNRLSSVDLEQVFTGPAISIPPSESEIIQDNGGCVTPIRLSSPIGSDYSLVSDGDNRGSAAGSPVQPMAQERTISEDSVMRSIPFLFQCMRCQLSAVVSRLIVAKCLVVHPHFRDVLDSLSARCQTALQSLPIFPSLDADFPFAALSTDSPVMLPRCSQITNLPSELLKALTRDIRVVLVTAASTVRVMLSFSDWTPAVSSRLIKLLRYVDVVVLRLTCWY